MIYKTVTDIFNHEDESGDIKNYNEDQSIFYEFKNPEQNIISAVLLRGIYDATGRDSNWDTTYNKQEAVDWIYSNHRSDGSGGWSFLDICDLLSPNPHLLAKRIRELVKGGRMKNSIHYFFNVSDRADRYTKPRHDGARIFKSEKIEPQE